VFAPSAQGSRMRLWAPSPRLCLGLAVAAVVVWFGLKPMDRLEQLARLSAWLVAPEYVFVGDSLTKGGGLWGWRLGRNPFAAINLAQNGATPAAIAVQARIAAAYRPRRIVVMAGTNDAVREVNAGELRETWRRLYAAAGTIPVIAFVPPRASQPALSNNL